MRVVTPSAAAPDEAPYAAAEAAFAEAKAYLCSREAQQMSESDLERALHRRGQELLRKLLQGHLEQRQPGGGRRSGRGGRRCRALTAARARTPPGNDLRHGGGRAPGLRAARSRQSASARCRAEPAAGALLARGAPAGGRGTPCRGGPAATRGVGDRQADTAAPRGRPLPGGYGALQGSLPRRSRNNASSVRLWRKAIRIRHWARQVVEASVVEQGHGRVAQRTADCLRAAIQVEAQIRR